MFWKKLFTRDAVAEARVKALVAAASTVPLGDIYGTTSSVVELGEKTIDPLLRALESKNSNVRGRVGDAIGKLGPDAVPRLTAALESASPGAREEIAGAIATIGDPSTIPLLTKLLADPDKRVRWTVAYQLRYIENPMVIEALVEALDQTENGYRILNAVAGSLDKLGWTPKKKEHEILLDVLRLDPMSSLKPSGSAAVSNVTRHGKAAVKNLLMALEEDERPSDSAREYAVEALIAIGADENVLPALNNLVKRAQREDGYKGDLIKVASTAIVRIKEQSAAGPKPKPSLGLDAPKSAMEEVVTKDDLHVGNIIRIWHESMNQWATGWLLVEEFLGSQIVFWDYEANDHTTRHLSDSIPCWRDGAGKEVCEVEKGVAIDQIGQGGSFTASDHWERAIAAAVSGRRDEALREFGCAIEMNPNRYVSEIQPRSTRAYAVWDDAVQEYVRKKDESAAVSQSAENQCQRCEKDIGTDWHYGFESIVAAMIVGLKCPDCGLIFCKDHMKEGGEKLSVCPNCQTNLVWMQEGPAASSMVEKARSENRYRGTIKEPSAHGRPVR